MDETQEISAILKGRESAPIKVQTLGLFQLWRNGKLVSQKEWGRDISIQLFQFLITSRYRRGLHKEQILDGLWSDMDVKAGEQNFKAALHGLNKVLEPDRKSRSEAQFVLRQGLTYQLNLDTIWVDSIALEKLIAFGNEFFGDQNQIAAQAYKSAYSLYKGMYLPNRIYEDWSSEERERLQVLVLGALTSLSELLVEENPMESVRLAQEALQIDSAWEDAYRIQMQAYLNKGNRPMALKTYQHCVGVLEKEYGIEPLPETRALIEKIKAV